MENFPEVAFLRIFQERDSVNAFGRKWMVEVVEDVLDLPEVVDPRHPVSSEHFLCFYWI